MSKTSIQTFPTFRLQHASLGLFALGLLLVPQFVAPCGGSLGFTPATHRCGVAFQAVSLLAVVLLALGVALNFVRERRLRVLILLLISVGALAAFALPQSWALGICRRTDMACHTTQAWAMIFEAVLLIASLSTLLATLRSPERKQPAAVVPDSWEADVPCAAVPAAGETAKTPRKRCKCCG